MPWLGIENLEALPGVRGCSPLRGEKKRGMQREVLIFALGKKAVQVQHLILTMFKRWSYPKIELDEHNLCLCCCLYYLYTYLHVLYGETVSIRRKLGKEFSLSVNHPRPG